jgi:hypothetical protein
VTVSIRHVRDDADPLGIVRVVAQKYCPGCDSWKATRHFHKDRHRPDGYYHRCKSCRRPMQAAVSKRHAEKRRAANRQYRQEHRDALRVKERARYHADPADSRERKARSVARRRAEVNARGRAAYAANAEYYRAKAREYRARKKAEAAGLVPR